MTLGISESALRVRLRGPAGTPSDVRSRGTATAIEAMRRHGVGSLVVQTTFGIGATEGRLPTLERLYFRLVLAPQIRDTEPQERAVRASGLDWVLAQPVTLTDEPASGAPFASVDGELRSLRVARRRVAHFLVDAVEGGVPRHSSVAL